MSQQDIRIITCDNCGNVKDEVTDGSWLQLGSENGVSGHPLAMPWHERHFDTVECLAQWATTTAAVST